MGGFRVWGRVSGGWRRGLGVCSRPRHAGCDARARRQPQPRGSDPSGAPGWPRPGGLGREELLDALRAAQLHREGPLVTLNKPPGLPVSGKPGELTLQSVLPELSQALGTGPLQVVRAPGKEPSGLVLLSSCPETASRLQKYFSHCRKAQRPTATYWAVTDGIPTPSEGKICVALALVHTDDVSRVVPVKSPSRKDIVEGVKRTLSHFRVMATGSGCALVQLQPLTGFPCQLQVHLMLQLCPVLGDHAYAARVGTVLGQRFLLPADARPRTQVLDDALLGLLRLTPAQATRLPLHLHLHRLLLPSTSRRGAPGELLAPLPPYFSRTLQCLGLPE
ncbi:mitochondrial mRNA pseudouridine synthase RPUSD3 [Perognathus longimembris pacificus]|uniref:mitochondrial mRNA pseudouridine synthase RPUSD3 n=1 Tax=Perognathus longimembris pacificus TaxID=214514 RepID=UPI002019A3B6|nr:mitochondrial mRNA pseudouridine synthase RPUSD3 [Perognathus longimembris pacificus]XP_048212217.1 mitochondrial mRNA pseudouridine synthase RPUSD3 [Perognathus longimembris pacificus]